jgi:hypothetical protein
VYEWQYHKLYYVSYAGKVQHRASSWQCTSYGAYLPIFCCWRTDNKDQMKEIAEQAAIWTQAFVNALDVIKTDTDELEYLRPDVAAICQYMRSICMNHGTTDDHC